MVVVNIWSTENVQFLGGAASPEVTELIDRTYRVLCQHYGYAWQMLTPGIKRDLLTAELIRIPLYTRNFSGVEVEAARLVAKHFFDVIPD